MFLSVFRFELASWFKRPLTLLFFVLFFLLAFFSTASDSFLNVGGTGQIHRNAPFVLATAVAVLTAIGQVITTAIAGTAVLMIVESSCSGWTRVGARVPRRTQPAVLRAERSSSIPTRRSVFCRARSSTWSPRSRIPASASLPAGI